jgi:CubicO group peptidase (beta-lactamase class C family)
MGMYRRTALQLFPLIVALGLATPHAVQSFEWQIDTPAKQGFSEEKLKAMQERLAAKGTKALLIARNDRIVLEWYADPEKKSHYTASMAKALVGGIAVAVALTDGKMSLDDPAYKFVPQWRDDPTRSKITVRQLGSHTSGLDDAEKENQPHDKLTGWQGDFWKRLPVPNDPFSVSRDKTPVVSEPGSEWAYSNPGIAMLTYCTTAATKAGEHNDHGAPKRDDIRTLLRERVMRPIGVPDSEWSVGYNQTFEVDGLPLVGSWGGGTYSARASARVGRLMLRLGDWDGKQILSKDAVQAITADAGTPGPNGIGWWSNNEGRYPKLPRDAYWAAGAQHQILLVVPTLNIILLRNGADMSGPGDYDRGVANSLLFEPLMEALTDPSARK